MSDYSFPRPIPLISGNRARRTCGCRWRETARMLRCCVNVARVPLDGARCVEGNWQRKLDNAMCKGRTPMPKSESRYKAGAGSAWAKIEKDRRGEITRNDSGS
jgi:hypothetical protein